MTVMGEQWVEQLAREVEQLDPSAEVDGETIMGEDDHGQEIPVSWAVFVHTTESVTVGAKTFEEVGEAYFIPGGETVFAGKWGDSHEAPIYGDHRQERDVALALLYACELDRVLSDVDDLHEKELEL